MTCVKCNQPNDFRPNRNICRPCENLQRQARRDSDHDRVVKQNWRKANPEKEWYIRKACKANSRHPTQKITVQDVREVFGPAPICGMCGTSQKKILQLDHIEPLARGGDNKKENLGVLCKTHNRQKGDKIPGDPEPVIIANISTNTITSSNVGGIPMGVNYIDTTSGAMYMQTSTGFVKIGTV